MPGKRIINKDDYPMIICWDNYVNTHTKLICRCDGCGVILNKSIKEIDKQRKCHCRKCSAKISNSEIKRNINWDLYPMVIDNSNYKNTHTPLDCRCDGCNIILKKSIKQLDVLVGGFFCRSCVYQNKTKKTNEKIYGGHPLTSDNIKDKIKNTNNTNHGVEWFTQTEYFKEKSIQSSMERFGVPYYNQSNRELWQIDVTSNKENFEKYLKSLDRKYTSVELSELLGYNQHQQINRIIKLWDLGEYIDRNTSSIEKTFMDFIESLGFSILKKKFDKYEIDCYISELGVGFEFNGNYWHSDFIVDKNYHFNKITYFQEMGVRLINIWEYEWNNNNQEIKSYIKAQLGLCEYRLFARNCYVKEITLKECKHLLLYHQQKTIHASKYIGLFNNNDELVLCMLFSKPRQDKSLEWEVVREVCKENYIIVGGKSKVFNYFIKKYNPTSVLSYVDRQKFTGKSYQIMGFRLEEVCPPRYDWVLNGKFIKRQPRRYKNMMERYKLRRVLRIYDGGRYKYVWMNPRYSELPPPNL